ncbi:MAG: lipase family protein [Jatrophihabitans sp.]|uniref:lipase family protein n=1 Tax=Jatrophihabitans sp. TaxID=1932789 RepID=UPI003F8155E3
MPPDPISVTGGADGIAASCERLRAAAGGLGDAAAHVASISWTLHACLVEPDILGAGLAAPLQLAVFETTLGLALDGPTGLTALAVRLGELDALLRLAALRYEAVDHLDAWLGDIVLGAVRVPIALVAVGSRLARGADPLTALEAVVTVDPELADTVATALGLPALLAATSGHLPDGRAVVTALGADPAAEATRPPRSLADLVGELAHRDDGAHGEIDVRVLTGAGPRRVVVDITGTKTASLAPTPDVTGLITDGKALVGRRTTYEDGVLAALQHAGVRPDDDVMLVGHSEGGMVAVTAARDAVRSGRFRVTHVVTAGSPVGLTADDLPRGVQLLALENGHDVVPHLDGRRNPDRADVTTVTGEIDAGGVVADHGLRTGYAPIAAAADASTDGSVRAFLAGARGFLTADEVTTLRYVVTRGP